MGNIISIIIPTYNNKKSIVEAINSVYLQTSNNWELIVVDDGSTDQTGDYLMEFELDDRFSFHYKKNEGVSAARNFGAEIAKGAFLLFLDSDDKLFKDTIKKFQELIGNVNDLGIASGPYFSEFRNNNIKPKIRKIVSDKHCINILCGSFIVKRDLFLRCGGYDIDLRHSENWELFIRLTRMCSKSGLKICAIDTPTFSYNNFHTFNNKNNNYYNKYVSHQKLYYKYKNVLGKSFNVKMAEIVAFNALKVGKKSQSIEWQLRALQYLPGSLKSYLRLIRYILSWIKN